MFPIHVEHFPWYLDWVGLGWIFFSLFFARRFSSNQIEFDVCIFFYVTLNRLKKEIKRSTGEHCVWISKTWPNEKKKTPTRDPQWNCLKISSFLLILWQFSGCTHLIEKIILVAACSTCSTINRKRIRTKSISLPKQMQLY